MIEQDLQAFLSEWHSDSSTVLVHTSGSTGVPKSLKAEKARMLASARMTCDFLGLEQGDRALLCMPLKYIAGKMMVVRAVERGMRLVVREPSGHPLSTPIEEKGGKLFAAMVPSQVWNSLQVPEERERLQEIDQLIIGGGAVEEELANELRVFPHAIWSTYGMTETLSHIALRRINGPQASDWYTPFDGVTVSQTEEGCLVIEASNVNPQKLITHDIVEFNDEGAFRIIGRTDNIISSGGVKIQIEQVESALKTRFGNTIMVTSVPHPKWGEAVIYLTTKPIDEQLLHLCVNNPFWLPKYLVQVDKLPLTGTGKPDRAKAKDVARCHIESKQNKEH